jgi:hypothetical protein
MGENCISYFIFICHISDFRFHMNIIMRVGVGIVVQPRTSRTAYQVHVLLCNVMVPLLPPVNCVEDSWGWRLHATSAQLAARFTSECSMHLSGTKKKKKKATHDSTRVCVC